MSRDDLRGDAAPRSALVALLLSGVGPGTGHVYAGRPVRGALLALGLVALFALFARWLVTSWLLARLGALLVCLGTLAFLADAARCARRAPRPFTPGPLNRGWVYAVALLLTGFLAPAALTAWLGTRVGLVRVEDESMADGGLVEGDWVVVERSLRGRAPARGEIVFVALAAASRPARVVRLPGERAASGGSRADATPLGPDEVLVLSGADPPTRLRVHLDDLRGRVAYVLFPGDLDALRVGEPLP